MNNHRLEFQIDGKKVIIVLPFFDNKTLKFETFAPLPERAKGNIVVMVDQNDFTADMNSLIPKTLKGSPFDNSVESLIETIEKHMTKYGRILPGDLFTYINEAIILIFAISDQIFNQKLNQNHGKQYFAVLFKLVWSAFSQDLKELFYECGKQDPMTNYIIESCT
ncbi:MAG: hypothetical protein GX660_04180 [Clostridiaceae bacterium]|nr:hypothetical protein [Clostridiaceae bacterium]